MTQGKAITQRNDFVLGVRFGKRQSCIALGKFPGAACLPRRLSAAANRWSSYPIPRPRISINLSKSSLRTARVGVVEVAG
jgi:hypothetical protein